MSELKHTRLFDNLDQLLTYEQLSQWLGLSVRTLEKYVHRSEIPFVKLKRSVRFRIHDIEIWLQSKTIGEKHGN